MKKISFFFACVAIAMAGALSSCTSSDTPAAPKVVSDVVIEESNTLKISSKVAATFTFGNETKQGKEVEFTTTAKTVNYTVKADGYVTLEGTIDFSDKQKVTEIEVELVKASTNQVEQAAAKGATIENDNSNKEAVAEASIVVPADVTISGNTTDPFSITAFEPAPEIKAAEDIQEIEAADVLGFVCTPDGAKFSEPVTLKTTIEDGEDLEFEVEDALSEPVLVGNELSFKVDHFSKWKIALKVYKVTKTTGVKEIYHNNIQVNDGVNTFSFEKNTGFSTSEKNKTINKYLKKKFGKKDGNATVDGVFTVQGSGSAVVVINQAYTDFSLKSGKKTFVVRVWQDCIATVTTSPDTGGHSGGVAQ